MSSKQILFWLNRKRTTPRFVRQVTFLAEKVGQPEQQFEKSLCELFDRHELIMRAYLALVEYSDGPSPRAALCLACLPTIDEEEILDKTAEIFQKFKAIFDPTLFLDVLFLMDFQELEIIAVCKPFYKR
jgi:hypothetical protein